MSFLRIPIIPSTMGLLLLSATTFQVINVPVKIIFPEFILQKESTIISLLGTFVLFFFFLCMTYFLG